MSAIGQAYTISVITASFRKAHVPRCHFVFSLVLAPSTARNRRGSLLTSSRGRPIRVSGAIDPRRPQHLPRIGPGRSSRVGRRISGRYAGGGCVGRRRRRRLRAAPLGRVGGRLQEVLGEIDRPRGHFFRPRLLQGDRIRDSPAEVRLQNIVYAELQARLMLQIVIVVVIIMMMVAVVTDTVRYAVRGRKGTSILLPDAGWRRRASRIPLQKLADREPMLVHRIRRHVLHLRALLQMRVSVGVMQMLAVMRHQRGGLPRISAGGGMKNARCRSLESGYRHGRRR